MEWRQDPLDLSYSVEGSKTKHAFAEKYKKGMVLKGILDRNGVKLVTGTNMPTDGEVVKEDQQKY